MDPLAKKKTFDRQAFVPFLMEVITYRIAANANRLYQSKFGVGLPEWRVISALALEPGSTVVELSTRSNIDAGAVSRVVFSLRRSGLISHKVDTADRRRRKLVLTTTGLALHDEMLTAALRGEDRLLQCLSPDERRGLILALQKLFDRIMDRGNRDTLPVIEAVGPKRRLR
jgi:DNA-binding MarR family transcriptional regulator